VRLKDAATKFDTLKAYDGYSGAYVGRVQSSTFLESASVGGASVKRTMSAVPTLVIPSHNVLMILDQLTLIGMSNADEWANETIRKMYWTKRVTDSLKILTAGEAAAGSVGVSAYGQKMYLKSTVNTLNDASYNPFWNIFLSPSTGVAKGTFLRSGTVLYRARSAYADLDGFLTTECDEIDAPVTATFTTTGVYDPVTDAYVAANTPVQSLLVDYYKIYKTETAADALAHAGDKALLIPTISITPKINQAVTVAGKAWTVLNLHQEQDAWVLHLRLV